MDSPAGRTLGDFTVHERLAAGGGGVIHRAEQRSLGRDAVIKLLQADPMPAARDRFLREAQLASRLDHPYAAHIYAFGAEPDGLLWIAMERVRGASLDHVLAGQPRRRMAVPRFVPLLELICEVVQAAHDQGIVHRDLKPSNIMVLARAGRLLPKLLDFGIAQPVGDAAPGAVGSPPYMAPELWDAGDGRAVDPRSDIYALGALAFEALTGAPPFAAPTLGALASLHRTAPPPALPEDLIGELPAGVAPGLAEALGAALAKAPADRPSSALGFARAMRIAAGANVSPDTLPRLDAVVQRDAAWLPQPIADAVAALDTARNPHQARDAVHALAGVAARYLGLIALAARSRDGADAPDAPEVSEPLRALHDHDLGPAGWLALTAALVRPYATARERHPIPELVDLCSGPDAGPDTGPDAENAGELTAVFAPLLAAGPDAAIGEAPLHDRLTAQLPAVARLLRALSFLTDYQLVVPRAAGGELWMGPRRARRAWLTLAHAGDLPLGQPILVDFDGRPVLQLAPLLQVAPPAPGAGEELFLFAGGRRGPGWARLIAEPHGFERLDDALWDWFRAHLVAPDPGAAPVGDDAPYRGLRAFTAADAGKYFGRERAAGAFANQLLLHPLVAVVGPSGAGKSSFVHAGVLPRLPAGWRTVTMRPGATPAVTLAALLAGAPDGPADQAAAMQVIVVDQFEEIFTLCRDPDERTRFAARLAGAARSIDDRVRVVLTMRDDFLVRAGELAPLRDRLAQGLTLLATPAPDDLVRVLVEPARQVGYRFDDPDLPRAMADAVAGRPGALALLSFTAARLWELRDRHFHQLTRKAYDAIGGVEGALAGHAEATLLACATEQQRQVRQVFRHLVTAEGTRAVVDRRELGAVAADAVAADAVIERLIEARLVVAAEADTGAEQIEIIHEALLTSWPRLVEWQREDALGARLRDQLRSAARQWDERGRPRGLLWRGDALGDYRHWRTRWPGELPAVDLAFATASVRDEARGRRIRRTLAATALGLLIAAVTALAMLYRSSSEHAAAAHDRLIQSYAEQGRRLLLDGEYLRALPYLAEAYAQGEPSAALRFLVARAERLAGAELAVHRHAGRARAAAFRHDGRHVLSIADDGEAAVWDAATGEVTAALPGHPGGPYYGKVSHDGAFAVIPDLDGAMIWDGARTTPLVAGRADRVAIDAGGERVAIAGQGALSVWRVATGERLWTAPLAGATNLLVWSGDAVVAVGVDRVARIARDGQVTTLATRGPVTTLAFGARAGIVTIAGAVSEVWDAAGSRLRTIELDSPIGAAALGRDGALLALGTDDGTVRLYATATGQLTGQLAGPHAFPVSLAFSDDGRQLATTATDLTLRIWDVAEHQLITSLLGARDQYIPAALRFDATGARLVAPSWDGAVRVFATGDPDAEVRIDAGAPLTAGVMTGTAPGDRLITGDPHAVRTWSRTGAALHGLELSAAGSPQLQLSPDGRRAAVLLPGSDAELRDVATGALLARLHGSDHFLAAAFDHTGDRVVTGSAGHQVELWDAHGARLAIWRGHRDLVGAVAFSPDDRRVASGSSDQTARVWDVATGRELAQLTGADAVTSVELDPTATRLLTGNADRLVQLWDLATRTPVRTFEHTSEVRAATASPDGALIAGATVDGTVDVWDAASSSLLSEFRHHASVHSVQFAGASRLLSTSSDHHAVVWRLDLEQRSHQAVTAFVRCHTPYRLVDTRLEPATPICPRP